jgi:hypothetical protein
MRPQSFDTPSVVAIFLLVGLVVLVGVLAAGWFAG